MAAAFSAGPKNPPLPRPGPGAPVAPAACGGGPPPPTSVVRNPASSVASRAAPDRIQKEIIRTSPLAVAAAVGAEICTSVDRCGFGLTSMRRALENGWPLTATEDIFANSPAALLNVNADAESAGRSVVAPVWACAAQVMAANPALRMAVRNRFMRWV